MFDLNTLTRKFDEELGLVNSYIGEYLNTDMEAGAVRDVLGVANRSRGKMIRPSLLMLSARFGKSYEAGLERLCKLGSLIEIIHMASLIHDDIVDDSPFRRGRLTIQAEFGKDIAVYAGDFLLCRVMFHLFRENMGEYGMLLARTMEDMCRGEIGQMACRWDTETPLGTYLKNIYGKTVALFMAVCQIGAMESGCGEKDARRLRSLGEHFGYMFQMRDDLLDFLADEEQEGKPLHKDFGDGIYTMPVLYALENSDCAERLRVIAAQDPAGGNYAQHMAEMRRLVCNSGGLEYTWNQIDNHAREAERILANLPECDSSGAIWELICWMKASCGFSDFAMSY